MNIGPALVAIFLLFLMATPLVRSYTGSASAYTPSGSSERGTGKDGYRIAAERACAEAEKLLAEWKAELLPKAIKKYDVAVMKWRNAGARMEEADALSRIGEIYEWSDDRKKALEYYNQALTISRALKDRQRVAGALNHIGYVYLLLFERPKAWEYSSEALKLSREGAHKREEAQALYNIGEFYFWSGDLQKSLDHCKEALPLWQALNDSRGLAQTLTLLGFTYSHLSESQKALHSYEEALSLWNEAKNYRGKAQTLTALGHLYNRLGDKQKALNFYNDAIRLIQSVGGGSWEAAALNGIGYVYEGLGENHRALEHYNRALRLYEAMDLPAGKAATLKEIGRAYHSLGDNQRAIDSYQKALSMAQALADQLLKSYVLREIGNVYASWGDNAKALGYYEQALSIYRSRGDRREEANTRNSIGRIYEVWSEREKALSFYDEALSLNRMGGDRVRESLTLYNIARVERGRGNLGEARSRLEASLEIVESLRTNVASQELRTSYFASVRQRYDFYIDLLMRLQKQQPAGGFDAAALQASERARARSLLESLAEARADIREGVSPDLLEQERSLQQMLSDKTDRKMKLLSGKPYESETAAIAKEISDLTTRYEEVQGLIRSTSPRYAALTQPQPLGLKEIQVLLDENTLLLEYSLGEERSYLWAVTQTSITSHELPNRAEIEKTARRVYELLIAGQPGQTAGQVTSPTEADAQYWREAASLSRTLLGPVANQLGNRRLLIIPEGALQYLPFAALPVPGSTGISNGQKSADSTASLDVPVPLVEKNEIVSLPSASVLAVLRHDSRQREAQTRLVAVLADPVFDSDDPRLAVVVAGGKKTTRTRRPAFAPGPQEDASDLHRALRSAGVLRDGTSIPRLLSTRREAEAIMAVTPEKAGLKAVDFQASRVTATSPELRQYRIVHFATHGLINDQHPELSGIMLSLIDEQGRPQNGFLRLHDIYNLNLPAELVVLSACSTGLGKDVKGEGMVGIVRGFMYAGAARVVASLWKVEDEATAELMKRFYQQMFEGGLAPAAALRTAQIAMRQNKRWGSPYYWAAFVLQGDWRGWLWTATPHHSSKYQRADSRG